MTATACVPDPDLLIRAVAAMDHAPGPGCCGLDRLDRARIGRFLTAQGDGIDDSRLGCWIAARSAHIIPGRSLGEAVRGAHGLTAREIPTPAQVLYVLERAASARQ